MKNGISGFREKLWIVICEIFLIVITRDIDDPRRTDRHGDIEAMIDSKLVMAWQNLDRAASSVLVAQPHRMTQAAEELSKAQKNMRDVIYAILKEPLCPSTN